MTRTSNLRSAPGRRLLFGTLFALAFASAPAANSSPSSPADWRVQPLAQTGIVVHRSPDPENIYLGTPSILARPSRRLIAACDHFGPGVDRLGGPIGIRPRFDSRSNKLQTHVFTSNDGGNSWTRRAALPFTHARLFADGDKIYLLGHCGKVMIACSRDQGETWTPLASLTQDDCWAMGAANVHAANGKLYAAVMRITDFSYKGYFVSTLAPVVFRAAQGADLLDAGAWTQSQPQPAFRDLVDESKLDFFGVPFFSVPDRNRGKQIPGSRITANRIGWHEPYVVQITDPDHQFYDSTGRTLHILSRGDVHRSNFAVMAKVVESDSGEMRFQLERTPAGTSLLFVPMPGGNVKFHVLQDPQSELYWLVSSQITDSLHRVDRLPSERFGLPLDQRERLVLHFSKNLVDWVFAGLVAKGNSARESFHYCGMDIDGDDLVILSRTGDNNIRQPRAPYHDAHDTNLITFHRIRGFRRLVY